MIQLIQLQSLKKEFKGHTIINMLDFSLHKGELMGLVGKSGEGKTTFLRILIGFYKIDAGTIIFQGKDITKKPEQIIKHVGFCTQENSFYHELTIQENMQFYGRLYGIRKHELLQRIESLLKLVNLFERKEKLGGAISGGMKRRLDFAIALLHQPDILILDEPTAGLDPVMTKDIWELISTINQKGTTVLVSSHELDNIERYCSKIAVLSKGKIVVKTIEEIHKRFKEKSLMDVFEQLVVLSD